MRVLVGSDATITALFTGADGETPADTDDPPTVVVTDWNGTVLGDTLTADRVDTGVYSAVLGHATQTSRIDRLTTTWSGTVSGLQRTPVVLVEVVGAHLATLPELQAQDGTENGSTADILAARDSFAEIVEQALGASYVKRLFVEVLHPRRMHHRGWASLEPVAYVSKNKCGAVRYAAFNNVEADESTFSLSVSGGLYRVPPLAQLAWPFDQNLTIAYEYGYPVNGMAADHAQTVHDACLLYCGQHLTRINSAIQDSNPSGQTIAWSIPTPAKQQWTGYVQVDRLLQNCRQEHLMGVA